MKNNILKFIILFSGHNSVCYQPSPTRYTFLVFCVKLSITFNLFEIFMDGLSHLLLKIDSFIFQTHEAECIWVIKGFCVNNTYQVDSDSSVKVALTRNTYYQKFFLVFFESNIQLDVYLVYNAFYQRTSYGLVFTLQQFTDGSVG